MMREWFQRLRDRFRRDTLDRELREELAFHRAQLERDALHEGADAAAAQATARRRLGNETLLREEARERWSWPWLEHLLGDVRYAVRGLRRSPGFTATVVLTLGLGVGANATMFGVVDRLMYRPLAYLRDPASVHRIYWQWRDHARLVTSQSGPYTRYLDLQRETSSFAQLAAFQERYLAVGEGEDLRERRVGLVSASYFAFFDAVPTLGRYFTASEDVTPRGADVAVRLALGARPRGIIGLVVGRGMRLVLVGAVGGVIVAAAAARWIEPLLFRQRAVDPLSYLSVVALLLCVAFVACVRPAWRAAGADPAGALRAE